MVRQKDLKKYIYMYIIKNEPDNQNYTLHPQEEQV